MGNELSGAHEAAFFRRINQDLLSGCGAYWAEPGTFIQVLDDDRSVEKLVRRTERRLEGIFEGYGDPGQSEAWGWKDPRNTITLPVWRKIFPDAGVIQIFRNGLDVALSLHRREMIRHFQKNREKRLFRRL